MSLFHSPPVSHLSVASSPWQKGGPAWSGATARPVLREALTVGAGQDRAEDTS